MNKISAIALVFLGILISIYISLNFVFKNTAAEPNEELVSSSINRTEIGAADIPVTGLSISQATFYEYNPPLLGPKERYKNESEVDFTAPETAYWGMLSARSRAWYVNSYAACSLGEIEKILNTTGASDVYSLPDEKWLKAKESRSPLSWRFDVVFPSGNTYAFLVGIRKHGARKGEPFSRELVLDEGKWKVLAGGPPPTDNDFHTYYELKVFFEENAMSKAPVRFREWIKNVKN